MPEWTSTRANPMIDPALRVWHTEVALYLFLGGLAAGLMVLLALRRLLRPDAVPGRVTTLAAWSAPLLLGIGMLFLWLDLENRWNAYRFYLVFRPATPMSWGAWILVLVFPVSLLFAWSETSEVQRDRWVTTRLLPHWLRRRLHDLARHGTLAPWQRSLGAAQLVLGLCLGVYTGILLGTFAARPLWNSAALGPLFLVSGVSSAAAFLALLQPRAEDRQALAHLETPLLVLELVVMALWFTALATGGLPAQSAVRLFFGGDYTAAFWTLVVSLGLVTPLAAAAIEHRRGAVPGRATALLVLAGALALRWIVVEAGQVAPQVAQIGP